MTDDERAGAVLIELDGIARDCCRYEYGLPIYSEAERARLVAVVAAAIRAAVAAERGRIEAEAEAYAVRQDDAGDRRSGADCSAAMRYHAAIILRKFAARIREGVPDGR